MMLDAMGSALSGLQAQSLKMNSTANNVANSQTKGYAPSSVTLSETEQGGVSAQVQKSVDAPGTAQRADSQTSQVDLAKEMTTMMETKRMYQANMTTLDTSDKLVGHLLDTLG